MLTGKICKIIYVNVVCYQKEKGKSFSIIIKEKNYRETFSFSIYSCITVLLMPQLMSQSMMNIHIFKTLQH